MKGFNQITLVGNVGQEPEIRETSGGATVANFSLATSERYKTRDGETREDTQWHRIVAWRALADIVAKYVTKGAPLFLTGKVKYRKYEKDGDTKYITEIEARDIVLLGSRGSGAGNSPDAGPSNPFPSADDVDEGELPF